MSEISIYQKVFETMSTDIDKPKGWKIEETSPAETQTPSKKYKNTKFITLSYPKVQFLNKLHDNSLGTRMKEK